MFGYSCAIYIVFIKKIIVSSIFKQWNYSNDVILKFLNCSNLLWWSFCVSFFMDLYCFEWLQQETANTGKTKKKPSKSNKQNIQCSLVGYGRDFTYETGSFDIFSRVPHFLKYQNIMSHEWNHITNWISSIILCTIKKNLYSNCNFFTRLMLVFNIYLLDSKL